MSKNTRYWMIKKKYRDHFIIFMETNHKVSSYGMDQEIMKTLKINQLEKNLHFRNISYLILDNLTIVKKVDFLENNQYSKYFYFVEIQKILKTFVSR